MQYASCMKLVDKWTQKYRISNAYRIMHYFSIRLVFFLIYNNYWARNNLVKRSPVIATCVSSKAYILRGSLNAKFIWSIMPCVRIVLLWTLFYAYFFLYLLKFADLSKYIGRKWLTESINWKCWPYLFSFYTCCYEIQRCLHIIDRHFLYELYECCILTWSLKL